MKYLVDTQDGKILNGTRAHSEQWSHWVRTGRAKIIESEIPFNIAKFENGKIVEDAEKVSQIAQRDARKQSRLSAMASLRQLNPQTITNQAQAIAAVRLLVAAVSGDDL